MAYLLIILGFVLLIVGGNFLVDGSVAVARKLHVSSLLIGLILVGFGTSTPELLTSVIAAYKHAEGIAVGNVIGSNIANILLVLGVAAFLRPVPVRKKSFKRDSLFLSLSTVVLVFALMCGRIDFVLGFAMCAALAFYIFYSYKTEKHFPDSDDGDETSKKSLLFAFIKTVLGIGLTLYGAQLLVDNAVALAKAWGVDEKIVGLTVVALGTSLPELMTSIVASLKKESAVAFGNVVGSNIYNALFILGATALFFPVVVPEHVMPDLLMMVAATMLMLIFGWRGRLSRGVGAVFISLYIAYIFYLAQSI